MAGWSGFSEEELRKLQQKDQAVPAALGRGRKPAPTNRSRQQLQRERALQLAAEQKSGPGSPVLPPEQKLTKPLPQPAKPPPQAVIQPVVTPTKPVEEPSEKEPLTVNHAPAPAEDTPPIAKELEKQEVEFREKTRIELLQQDQKMMEERNKRKKALLTKTIAEKSKQTQAETVKLKRIQKDLQTLDNMVSNDICILRGVIEQASWDYNTARLFSILLQYIPIHSENNVPNAINRFQHMQSFLSDMKKGRKRYEKAESEYVTAKLDLHKKTEIKEQLTEHLCAIIQQNELRKAHKLEELLQQLHLQATEEEQEEEREEERKKSVMENQGEAHVQSPPDTGSTPGVETETQAGSAMLQQDYPAVTVTEPKGSDQDCKTANSPLAGQSAAEAPASAS